jgi:hypothetical protein
MDMRSCLKDRYVLCNIRNIHRLSYCVCYTHTHTRTHTHTHTHIHTRTHTHIHTRTYVYTYPFAIIIRPVVSFYFRRYIFPRLCLLDICLFFFRPFFVQKKKLKLLYASPVTNHIMKHVVKAKIFL